MAETGKRDLAQPEVIDHWTIPVFSRESPVLRPGSANSGMRESRLAIIEDSEDAFEVLIRPPAPGVELHNALGMGVMIALPFFLTLMIWRFPLLAQSSTQVGEMTRFDIVQMAIVILMVATMLWNSLLLYHMACRWTRLRLADGLITIRTPNWRGKEHVTQFPLTGIAKHPPGRYELAADLQLSGGETVYKFKLKNFLPQQQVTWLQMKLEERINTQAVGPTAIQEPAHA